MKSHTDNANPRIYVTTCISLVFYKGLVVADELQTELYVDKSNTAEHQKVLSVIDQLSFNKNQLIFDTCECPKIQAAKWLG